MLARTRLCALALFAFCGSAFGALTVAPVTESPAPVSSGVPERMGLNCVNGFSKNYCGTVLAGNTIGSVCPVPVPTPPSCSTMWIRDATLVAFLNSHTAACGSTSTQTCDETVNGRLKVVSNFTIRLHKHCPYRGCWDGTQATFEGSDGSVYVGTLMGTIGVGTHRTWSGPVLCPVGVGPSSRNCERCYDVTSDGTNWIIGYEATFKGANEATGEELCFSLSGDFYIPAGATGPKWNADWQVAGTADGIHLTFCP